jgi:hypothetical protein
MSAAAAGAGAAPAPAATWVPLDVKIHWFSFLSAKDLANCGRVCRSWVGLTSRAADAMLTMATCAESPAMLARPGKMRLLHRLQNVSAREARARMRARGRRA